MRRLDARVSVSGQVMPDDVAALAKSGVTVIICNRPDGEDPGQPAMQDVQRAAAAADVAFVAAPFQGRPPAHLVEALRQVLASTDGQIHAYCRSGGRSAATWALMRVEDGQDAPTVLSQARAAGYDLTSLFV